ncbi:MAG: 1-phosphofructokinase [Firmicutes bacterium]|nr:1-phosphofructokinase [Bacillota bacterium]
MITTITLNPSIDTRYMLDDFEKNGVFRAKKVHKTPGGKGLNVARVIKQLDKSVKTTGFLGGKSGDFIKESLDTLNIENSFIKIKNDTRSCIAILSKDGGQTEVLEPGPEVFKKEIDNFLLEYENLLLESDVICASGSLPKNIPSDMYKKLIEKAKSKDVKFILDTSGEALKKGISASPYLIKPNKEELEGIFKVKINSQKELIDYGKKLSKSGIEIVVISLGKKGAIVINKDKTYKVNLPKVNVVNPVGSGDSMVAGFAIGIKRGLNTKKLIEFASICGTANAMEDETGKVNLDNIKRLENKIEVKEIN